MFSFKESSDLSTLVLLRPIGIAILGKIDLLHRQETLLYECFLVSDLFRSQIHLQVENCAIFTNGLSNAIRITIGFLIECHLDCLTSMSLLDANYLPDWLSETGVSCVTSRDVDPLLFFPSLHGPRL